MQVSFHIAEAVRKGGFFAYAVNAGGRRVGVRHVNERRYSAKQGCARLGRHVSLRGHAGLAEMHVGIDSAGHDDFAVQADCFQS